MLRSLAVIAWKRRNRYVAVDKASSLHAHISLMATEDGDGEVTWSDLGDTIQAAQRTLKNVQHLSFHFMQVIAEPVPHSRKGVIALRKSWLRDNVS
jgi:hypothetical protein